MVRMLCLLLLAALLNVGTVVLAADRLPGQPIPQPGSKVPTIVVFGNSLSAGYSIAPAQAFPALLQEKIRARGWDFRVINAGLSGDTTAGGLRRIDWVLQQPIAVLVLELGANDGLRGLSLADARRNLQAIIDRTRKKYPDVKIVLAGMQVPSNLGHDYTSRFRAIFPELAAANDAALIPFLLEGVAGNPALNLPDGMHPTPTGHTIIAENVWKVLEPVLRSLQ